MSHDMRYDAAPGIVPRSASRPVLVAAGGTGGHVFPALAVADELRRRDVPVVWVGTRAGLEARIVPLSGIDIHWITVAGLRGKGFVGTVTGPLKLLLACLQSVWLLSRLKPRAVLGMGGFVSGPVGLAALFTRRPLVLHEQNAVAGLTNRHLARFASRVFSAMPDVFMAKTGAMAVGNPVRRALIDVARHRAGQQRSSTAPGALPASCDDAVLNILVVGGSRGAHALNTIVPAATFLLTRPCRVLHQTGTADLAAVRDAYATLTSATQSARSQAAKGHAIGSHAEAIAFIDDMPSAYAAADLVICRSGAMTVTELCAMSVPAILVPFPYAVDDHQTRNAEFLSNAGAAVLMPESGLTPATLAASIDEIDQQRDRLARMGAAAGALFKPAATEAVADALLEVAA